MSDTISVVVAEDHDLVKAGLIAMLETSDRIKVTGVASDGLETLERVRHLSPNILILDLSMPKMSGISVLQQVKRRYKETKVFVLTAADNVLIWHELLELGVFGVANKNIKPDELTEAILTAASGNVYVQPTIQEQLDEIPDLKNKRLSVREKQVIKLVAEGMKTKDIADVLEISDRTVSKHRENVMAKLGAASTAEIIHYANESGLTKIELSEIE